MSATYICVPCRWVQRGNRRDPENGAPIPPSCPSCQQPCNLMGTRWRAPSKRNHRAWRRIEAGDVWWDDRASGYRWRFAQKR